MNKKMKVAIIVILVGAVAIAAAVGVWYYKTKFYIPDKGGMERDLSDTVVSCSYSTGGGMDGGSMSMTIYLDDKNKVMFEYYNQPYAGAEEEFFSFQIPYEAVEQIRLKCKEFGVLNWGKLEYSEAVILDAPTTTVNFIYGDNEYCSVNSNFELPKNSAGFFSAFYEILDEYNARR